jgi:hypothetical protein
LRVVGSGGIAGSIDQVVDDLALAHAAPESACLPNSVDRCLGVTGKDVLGGECPHVVVETADQELSDAPLGRLWGCCRVLYYLPQCVELLQAERLT